MPEPWTPDQIRNLRARLRLPNQKALAKLLGTSQAAVSAWETGATKPRSGYVAALDALAASEPASPADRALREAAGQLASAAVAFVVAFRAALRGASEPTDG